MSTISPLAWQALATRAVASASGSVVPGLTISTAIIAPRPRTSPITGWRRAMSRSLGSMISPMPRAAAGRSSFAYVSIAPRAAAQATGFPP